MKKLMIYLLIFPLFVYAGVVVPQWIEGKVVKYDRDKVTLSVKGVDGQSKEVVVLRKSVVEPVGSKLQTGKKVYSIRSLAFPPEKEVKKEKKKKATQ